MPCLISRFLCSEIEQKSLRFHQSHDFQGFESLLNTDAPFWDGFFQKKKNTDFFQIQAPWTHTQTHSCVFACTYFRCVTLYVCVLIDWCVCVCVEIPECYADLMAHYKPTIILLLLKASPSPLGRLQHPLEIYSCCVKYFSDINIVLFPFWN